MGNKVVVVMATITRPTGEDKVRFDLACELIRKAKAAGHYVLVAEQHFYTEATRTFARLGAKVYPQNGPTPGADRRFLMAEAKKMADADPDIAMVLWTEEKPFLVEYFQYMIERMMAREAVALIPGRDKASWATWPEVQQLSGPLANMRYRQLFNVADDGPRDPFFGPAAFAPRVLDQFINFDPAANGITEKEDIWVQHYVVALMLLTGQKVTSLEISCEYPPEQRAEEEGPKRNEYIERRFNQLIQITGIWQRLRDRFLVIPRT